MGKGVCSKSRGCFLLTNFICSMHSFIGPLTSILIRIFTPSLSHSLTLSLTHSLPHSLTHPFIHSSTPPLTNSPTHSLPHSLSPSLIHSFTLLSPATHSLTVMAAGIPNPPSVSAYLHPSQSSTTGRHHSLSDMGKDALSSQAVISVTEHLFDVLEVCGDLFEDCMWIKRWQRLSRRYVI